MPSLRHTKKRYWIERFTHKIDQTIEALAAAEPGFRERLAQQARQRALRSLGLAELQAELDTIGAQMQELHHRQRQTLRAMRAVLRRLPLDMMVAAVPEEAALAEIGQAIDRQQAAHEEELLAQEERGQHILRLRRERHNLPDTLALATSPAGLRQLWARLLPLLGEEPTALLQAALTFSREPTNP